MARRQRSVYSRGRGKSQRAGSDVGAVVAAEIRKARHAAGLTQRQLAARLKRTASWVSATESGRRALHISDLDIIAGALGIEPLDLVRRAKRAMARGT